MEFLIECIIGCVIFTAIVIFPMLKNPLVQIHNYPPNVVTKVRELGLITDNQTHYSKVIIIKKIIAGIILGFILGFIVHNVNGADSFLSGFRYSYLIWLVLDWYDFLILDVVLFCHIKRFRIKGTENMKEYHDYFFHFKGSLKGMIIGLPVCVLVGLCTMIISSF